MRKPIALLIVALLLLSACGQAAGNTRQVTVTVDEWSMKLNQTSAPNGEVTFALKNNGKLVHEIAILKTDLPHDKIPLRPENKDKVQEPGNVGEIEDVDPGTTKQETFKLEPGNYVIVCNEPAHYAAGMHIAFVVK